MAFSGFEGLKPDIFTAFFTTRIWFGAQFSFKIFVPVPICMSYKTENDYLQDTELQITQKQAIPHHFV